MIGLLFVTRLGKRNISVDNVKERENVEVLGTDRKITLEFT